MHIPSTTSSKTSRPPESIPNGWLQHGANGKLTSGGGSVISETAGGALGSMYTRVYPSRGVTLTPYSGNAADIADAKSAPPVAGILPFTSAGPSKSYISPPASTLKRAVFTS